MKKNLTFAILFILFSQAPAFSQTLIGMWSFTNGSLADLSGHGLNGIATGNPTSATGANGLANTALKFDGVTDYITVPFSSIMQLSSYTIMAKVRPEGFYSGICQANGILWRGTEFSSDNYGLLFTDQPMDNDCNTASPMSNVFQSLAAGTSTNNSWINGPIVVPNTWYCLVATYGNDTMSLYVDGVRYVHFYWPNQFTSYNTDPISIGRSLNVSYPYFFNGIIDELRLYSGVVTPVIGESNFYCNMLTGVNDVPKLKIGISPNPVKDKLLITLPSEYESGDLILTNATGQVVMKTRFSSSSNQLNLEQFPAGIYFLRAVGKGFYLNEKITKQ